MLIKRETALQQEEKDIFAEQMNLHNHFDSYRSQHDDLAVKWYKQFTGYKEETEEDRIARKNGEAARSNLHIPRTYQIVDTIRARMVNTFFKNPPYLEFIPQPSNITRFSMQMAEDKAKIGSSLLDEQLRKNNIVAKFYDYATSFLVFPKGIMGVGWRYEEDYIKKKVPVPEIIQTQHGLQYTGNYVYEVRESLEKVWDDNEISNIDYFDFWADPKGVNIDHCRGVFHREFLTLEELIQRLQFLDWLGEGIIYLESPQELLELQSASNLERGNEKILSETGMAYDTSDIYYNSRDKEMLKNAEFEVLNYWENNRRVITVNRQKTVYVGPSPYWRHRKKPFIAASYDQLPNQFYGISAVQIISDLQEEENTIHNQRSDNVNFIINKMWKVRRGADIDESELVSRSHGVVYVDRMEDVDEFKMTDVAASSFSQQNIVSQIMENVLATPPVMQGAESPGDKTATETLKLTNNAGMRFDVKLSLFKDLDIKRLAYLMDMNNQQFIDDSRLVRFEQNNVVNWRSISPGEFIGERDYRPAGASVDPAANKQVRREQLSQMMQFLLQAGVPFIDYHKLILEWLQSFDIENAEKYIVPRELWQQQMMMFQQMQQGPTQAQQIQNAQTGRARGRRPQTERNPGEQTSGQVR